MQYRRPGFNPWVRKDPWRREWQPTLVFLTGKSNGQRSLVGYSPWGREELDTTELRTTTSPINNAVVVSGEHWWDSAINIHVSILP